MVALWKSMSLLWSARISPARAPVKNAMARNVCNSPVARCVLDAQFARVKMVFCGERWWNLWREGGFVFVWWNLIGDVVMWWNLGRKRRYLRAWWWQIWVLNLYRIGGVWRSRCWDFWCGDGKNRLQNRYDEVMRCGGCWWNLVVSDRRSGRFGVWIVCNLRRFWRVIFGRDWQMDLRLEFGLNLGRNLACDLVLNLALNLRCRANLMMKFEWNLWRNLIF